MTLTYTHTIDFASAADFGGVAMRGVDVRWTGAGTGIGVARTATALKTGDANRLNPPFAQGTCLR
jgi:hypothetical protein